MDLISGSLRFHWPCSPADIDQKELELFKLVTIKMVMVNDNKNDNKNICLQILQLNSALRLETKFQVYGGA